MRRGRNGSKAKPCEDASGESVDGLPNANPLKVGKHDKPVSAVDLFSSVLPEMRQPRRPRYWLPFMHRDEALRPWVVICTQIVITLKDSPCAVVDAEDFELDFGAALKIPPGEGLLRRTKNPIRLQPFLHVFVAGNGDELLSSAPNRLCDRMRSDACHGPVDDRREFVHDGDLVLRCLRENSRHRHSELLSIR